MSDEEDLNFVKISSNQTNSDCMSVLNENASTYMGVKTIPEGTIPDNNERSKKKKKKKKNKITKNKKAKKGKKRKDSYSSSSSSSSSPFFSPSSSSSSESSESESDSDSEFSSSEKSSSSSEKNNKKKRKNAKVKAKTKAKAKGKNTKKTNNNKKEIHKKVINEKKEENKKKDIEKNIKINKEKGNDNHENENAIKNNKIETIFEWDEGGNKVLVTGSFCEWKEFLSMEKNNEGKYSLTLFLPRGFHQYKFIVDDVWTYSKKQPKYEDNGNVNNFIDTTDYDNLEDEKNDELNNTNEEQQQKNEKNEKNNDELKEKKESIEIKEKNEEESKEKNKKKKKKIILEKNNISELKRNSSTHFLNSLHNYSIYYPLRSEFSKKPSALPGLYKTYYILNEKKNKMQTVKMNSSLINENKSERSQNQSLNNSLCIMNDISPHVQFQNLYHIHSNHLHSKDVIYHNTTITSIISRYRYKFSTFIYYNENKPIIENFVKMHSKTIKIKRGKISNIKNFYEC